jgi:hypothetical protein
MDGGSWDSSATALEAAPWWLPQGGRGDEARSCSTAREHGEGVGRAELLWEVVFKLCASVYVCRREGLLAGVGWRWRGRSVDEGAPCHSHCRAIS